MKQFWKTYRKWIAVLISCGAVFVVSFFFYGLPLEAVLYPCLLCAMILALAVGVDYGKKSARHKELSACRNRLASLPKDFPAPQTRGEEDLLACIFALEDRISEMEIASLSKEKETADYFSLWAHQIKTPLASMKLALQKEDSPLSLALLTEVARMEQYVEMAMTYFRLDGSDFVFEKIAVDEVLSSALRRFSIEFVYRKIVLNYTPTEALCISDRKWLLFVVEQLLSNALKYTQKGCITLSMKNRTLQIADTGMGIAPQDLPRIFEKGYTGTIGRQDQKASGLGLYLCKEICKKLCIEISATSQVGVGTVVSLTLPQEIKPRE